MRDLRLEDFEDRVGERFEAEAEGGLVSLELTRAQGLPRLVRESGSFRLEFSGPSDPVLPQSIYNLRSGEETFEVFIVPVARSAETTTYEAIFN